MKVVCLALLASGAFGARVANQEDLKRDVTYPGPSADDSLADVELPVKLTSSQRSQDRTSLRFVRHMLAMKGAEIDEVFCSRSTDDCATVDEYPGRNTHSELRFDQVVEELAKTPGREVRGEIRRLGDLGYLIFNELLWVNDWKTFPIGADLEDHRKARPIADALMGHDSEAWSRSMIRQSAQEFFEGRESLNPRDIDMFCNKIFHKIMLDMDLTDEEEQSFQDYKGSSTIISTLPRWVVSGFRWAFGLNTARQQRDVWLDKYQEQMDRDTRGIIPALEGRDRRFLADLILTAATSAGGISVPSIIGITMGILHGGENYDSGPVLPQNQRKLTSGNLEQMALETVRRFPVVVGFPWWDPENLSFRTVLNIAMAMRDPRAWEAPKEFQLRPLSEYHERKGMGSKIGTAWAQQGIGYNGLTPDSRGCPGQEMSVVIITEFLRAFMPSQDEWHVSTEGPIQITEGPSGTSDFTITRHGHAAEDIGTHHLATPAPESAEEADAESLAGLWR